MAATDFPVLEPSSRAELRAWLAENHAASSGVRLAIGKKGGTVTSLTYDDAVEEGLAFGWIDSTAHQLDSDRYTVLFTPRRPGSPWAKTNKLRVERLAADGQMTAAGMAAVESAKADGSWTLLDDIDALVMPDDLTSALESAGVADNFASLSDSSRRMVLYWIATAKRPETRAKRIAETVRAAAEGRIPL